MCPVSSLRLLYCHLISAPSGISLPPFDTLFLVASPHAVEWMVDRGLIMAFEVDTAKRDNATQYSRQLSSPQVGASHTDTPIPERIICIDANFYQNNPQTILRKTQNKTPQQIRILSHSRLHPDHRKTAPQIHPTTSTLFTIPSAWSRMCLSSRLVTHQ